MGGYGAILVIAASAQVGLTLDIPSGPTMASLDALGDQAGIDFVVTANLDGLTSPTVSGRMSVDTALARLLQAQNVRAIRLADGVYRIERAPVARISSPVPRATAPEPVTEVVVTASVRRGALAGTPGLNTLVRPAQTSGALSIGTEAISDLTATVDSTRLGAGRNKLFIRGIADSGFSGPLQATVGQYFGDIRLTFGSPDPDLALIDIDRVDVFEGPQGPRFGSGHIGGVVRYQPTAPRLGVDALQVRGAIGGIRRGGATADLALVANTAINATSAVRTVIYGQTLGGFSDPAIVPADRDRTQLSGARVNFRAVAKGWTVDVLALTQNIEAKDIQVAYHSADVLNQIKPAEPYGSKFSILGLTANRRRGKTHLTYTLSVSKQKTDERFDATAEAGGILTFVDRVQTSTAVAAEARLEHRLSDVWKVNGGVAMATASSTIENARYFPQAADSRAGFHRRRQFNEAAAFGEIAGTISDRWRMTYGMRLATASVSSAASFLDQPVPKMRDAAEVTTSTWTHALSSRWRVSGATDVFARVEQGVRPAGPTEAGLDASFSTPDRVLWSEVGLSTSLIPSARVEFSVGHVDWQNVQADAIAIGGDILTQNVGDGTLDFIQVKAQWQASDDLDFALSAFVNRSRLVSTRFSGIGGYDGSMPNVAPGSAQLGIYWHPAPIAGQRLQVSADFRYVGKSLLGVGPGFEEPQGGYVRSQLTARYGNEQQTIGVLISNLLNQSGSRFAIGSPYQLFRGQYMPMRPLTVQLTFESNF